MNQPIVAPYFPRAACWGTGKDFVPNARQVASPRFSSCEDGLQKPLLRKIASLLPSNARECHGILLEHWDVLGFGAWILGQVETPVCKANCSSSSLFSTSDAKPP